jgi:alanine racemase
MTLHTRVALLKKVPRGETVGYGRTFVKENDSLIATIPIGYQDGLKRGLSNCGKVIVNGVFAPVAGRISMDWTMIDVTNVPGGGVNVGDEVIVIGSQNGLGITAEEIGAQAQTISYEITCGISRRVPRVYK